MNDTDEKMSRGYYVFLLCLLGMLCGFGPFVTDMYLPTLPSMIDVFATTPSMVQLGLTMSMLGLAVGQVIFGPLSDRYGRKRILYSTLLLFSAATLGIIFSHTVEFFNVCRFVQGLGGAGAIVLSRSIATDCFSSKELAKAMALIGAINGIAPVSAPVIGGLVAGSIGWRGIFWILFGLGAVLLLGAVRFRESLPEERRVSDGFMPLLHSITGLFANRRFVLYVLLSGFANGVLFSYISSASFIIQNHYGFSELIFSLVFAVNAIGIGAGSAVMVKFRTLKSAAVAGTLVMTICGIMQFVGDVTLNSFMAYEGMMLPTVFGLGLVFSSSTTLAMNEGRQFPGSASAIFGAVGFLFGGLVSPLVGIGDILRTSSILIILCSGVCLALAVACPKIKAE